MVIFNNPESNNNKSNTYYIPDKNVQKIEQVLLIIFFS